MSTARKILGQKKRRAPALQTVENSKPVLKEGKSSVRVSSHGAFCTPRTLTPTDAYGRVGRPLRATNPAITDTANRTIVTKFTILAASMGTSAIRSQAKPASSTRGTGSVIGKYR